MTPELSFLMESITMMLREMPPVLCLLTSARQRRLLVSVLGLYVVMMRTLLRCNIFNIGMLLSNTDLQSFLVHWNGCHT